MTTETKKPKRNDFKDFFKDMPVNLYLYVSKNKDKTAGRALPAGAVGDSDGFVADAKYQKDYADDYSIMKEKLRNLKSFVVEGPVPDTANEPCREVIVCEDTAVFDD